MDAAVRDYIAAIAPEQRPLFDRIHGLIMREYPDADVVLSYKMPTYKVADRSICVAVWKHGVSFYGWQQGHDAGFSARHPELDSGKGTMKLPPDVAARIPDDELRDFLRATLDG
jgi:uncharacterized protein YdhG (YjbR/CyaY superfamily)